MQRATIDVRPARGGVRSQTFKVTSGQTGVVAQLRSGLAGDVVHSKLSGSSNISISNAGAVSITAALALGASQTAVVRASVGAANLASEWPVTITNPASVVALQLTAPNVAAAAPINALVGRVTGGSGNYTLVSNGGGRFAVQADGIIRCTATALGAGPYTITVSDGAGSTDIDITVLPAGELIPLGSTSLKGPNAAKRQALILHIGDSTVKSGTFPIDEYTRRWDGKTLVWFRQTAVANGLYAAVEPLDGPGTAGQEANTGTGPLNELWRGYRRIAPDHVFDNDVEYVMFQYQAAGSGFSTKLLSPGCWTVGSGDHWTRAQIRPDAFLAAVPNSYVDTVIISLLSNDCQTQTPEDKLDIWNPTLGGVEYPVSQGVTDMTDLITAIRAKYGSQVKIVLSNIAPAYVGTTGGLAPAFEAALDAFQDTIPFCWSADLRSPTTVPSTSVHYDTQNQQNELAVRLATATRLAEFNNVAGGSVSVPDAPVLTLTAGTGQIAISAPTPANNGRRIQYYELQWSANGSTGWATLPGFVRKSSVSGPSFVHTGLANSTTYHYRARAVSILGAGAWSAIANAATSGGFDPAAGLLNRIVAGDLNAVTDTAGGATVTKGSGLTTVADAGSPTGYVWVQDLTQRLISWLISPTPSFTYSVWVNFSSVITQGGIIAEGRTDTAPQPCQLYVQGNIQTVRGDFAAQNGITRDTAVVANGVWEHLTWTYDNGTNLLRLYRGGILVDTDTPTNPRDLTATRAITGYSNSNNPNTNNAARGNFSSIRRWNKALDASEVVALHALGRGAA